MYYASQSLVIFVIGAVLGFISNILRILPVIGSLINIAVGILVLALWAVSWIYALSGEEKKIPIVSTYAKKINL